MLEGNLHKFNADKQNDYTRRYDVLKAHFTKNTPILFIDTALLPKSEN
ncbi:hypothetical protein BTN50_1672 (plasmid) [Candidatus Enterovibrio altilux]|uniref:Uncharacterized protein n=1 Tax=Candidatus Enterovibrio altilux TaxID=1927128 RepID=A0A291BAR2_9GAMM|nr:hypothetical protein BTN50_1672 [Candidatus Enterovibrio luxaltus]